MKISGTMPKVTSGASMKKPAPQPKASYGSSAGAIGKQGAKINIKA